ncbi:phosphate regulon sensor histidine kinase PhoR [Vogesella sp. GCM10023246]|uniref:Phosphate regulon sensor protein PhoR n=1 Tax=Vogesella oryzagri TaxID=3160864 RepID=A0ABV1M2J7_9NEIS
MAEFLVVRLVTLVVIAVISLISGLVWGELTGLALMLGLLVSWLGFHLYHLGQLLRWLERPAPRRVPDGFGPWNTVFMALYRQARRQKQSKRRLAIVLDRFINASEAMPDGVVVLDEYDRIEWINPMAVDHLGLDRRKDVGSQILNLVREPEFHDYMAEQRYSQPLILRSTGNGPELVLSIQLVPFDIKRKLLLTRDITQLERVQTVHRDFVANVSHELRTPLTVVGGFLETLSDMPAVDDATLRQFLPMMLEQSRRMQSLVEDLLTLSRIENSPHGVAPDTVDMGAMLDTLLVEAEGLSQGRHRIELQRDSAHNLLGNQQELHSAFGNLVSNAVRYTPEGGSITLRWRELDDGRAAFSVADTGIGIPPEHLPRLTERFYRVDRGRSRSNGGTGLGLAIVKHVLMRHHGKLEVRSEPEKGSEFSVVFSPEQVA